MITVEEATIDRLEEFVSELQEETGAAWKALDVDGLDTIDAPTLAAAIEMLLADRAVFQRRIVSLTHRATSAEASLRQIHTIIDIHLERTE